jgi:hypothetical protein
MTIAGGIASLAVAVMLAIPVGGEVVAQDSSARAQPVERSVRGRLFLGKPGGPVPLAGKWVVLHRVDSREGAARSASGPVDSVRTGRGGDFFMRYRGVGGDSVIHIVLATHGGIMYPTPLEAEHVSGTAGEITVFDTTSGPFPIRVQGRHLIIFAPDNDARAVGEVYELSNDSSVTVVSRVDAPVWTARIPAAVTDLRVNPRGDIPASAVAWDGDRVEVRAPLSPGIRQLSFTYTLPTSAFPLSVTVQDSTDVLEVLVQDVRATVSGAGLAEVEPVALEGRPFRRFLARGVARGATVTVVADGDPLASPWQIMGPVLAILGIAMVGSLAMAIRHRRPVAIQADPVDDLLRDIATIDSRMERDRTASEEVRARYARDRALARDRLAALLAQRSEVAAGQSRE